MSISPYWVAAVIAAVGLGAEWYAESAAGWAGRQIWLVVALCGVCFPAALVVGLKPDLLTALVAAVGIYRVINIMRLSQNRWPAEYLRHRARRTTVTLVLAQAALLGLLALLTLDDFGVSTTHLLSGLAGVQTAVAAVLCASAVRTLRKSRPTPVTKPLTDKELPTVSICIPARNETEDLPPCLRSVIANDYPKLEILVFDDCSHDRTPEIIRGFAHDGVRFIGGEEPKEGWLGKNQAYQTLYEQAEGDILLFCGVDVRLGTDTIRRLVGTLDERKKDMASVMPRRRGGGLRAVIIQPMRYWWEVALPRRTFNRPPVLSTLWMVRRSALKRLGGFKAVKGKIVPEAYFARELVRHDAYTFLRSDSTPAEPGSGGGGLQLETVKRWRDQRDTALRMRYPQVRRRPELVLLLTLAGLALLLGPFVVAIGGFWWSGAQAAQWPAAVAAIILLITHGVVVAATNPDNVLLAVLTFPLAALSELIIGNASMLKYEFSDVDWKGRNVCLPVLQAIPKLPPA